jgi:hypothetical protein
VVFILLVSSTSLAQTTGFTYQGRLTDGGTPANGVFDLQFALWDSQSGGNQMGSTQNLNGVTVTGGTFTVTLDFGANAFPGASRFLEIGARVSGAGSFTLLTPRQTITSTPYAVRSLRATSADSVPVTGVPAGSGNYIQNSSSPQTVSNFNISGNGTAGGTLAGNTVNATTQFNLNGSRILSNPGTGNIFAGVGGGAANTTGARNSFFGSNAGAANTTGEGNTFIGFEAGKVNIGGYNDGNFNTFVGSQAGAQSTGHRNAFFGTFAGAESITGSFNSFFGLSSGYRTTGSSNSFFGASTGYSNTTGGHNVFVGDRAGDFNTTGSSNVFVGGFAVLSTGGSGESGVLTGGANATGSNNTLIGSGADVGSGDLTNATAIGHLAEVSQSNSLVLGSINGVNFATADTNVGIGTTAPKTRLHVNGQALWLTGGNGAGLPTTAGAGLRLYDDGTRSMIFAYDYAANATRTLVLQEPGGNVGIGTTATDQRLSVLGNASKSSGGTSWAVFSDDRLKNIKGHFKPGLETLLRLQPIRYRYKPDNALGLPSGNDEVGFSAQAVAKVLPEAVSLTNQGYLQLQSDPILWTMLNAIKEQQMQIKQQQKQIAGLKRLVCRSRMRAAVCK